MNTLEEKLERREIVVLDGATGTELERRGVPMHGVAWSAAALETHPDLVRQVHEDYIRAGADIIIANTFATARHVLERAGMENKVRDLNTRAIALAQEARDATSGDRAVYIAGSISTAFMPSLSSGSALSEAQARANFRDQAETLAEAGVDLIMLEMMTDMERSAHAIEGALSAGLPTWIGYSCRLRDGDSEVLLLHSEDETLAEAMAFHMPLGGSLVSVMHTEVKTTIPALQVVQEHWSGPLGAYAHSGRFTMPNWQFENIVNPEDYLAEVRAWTSMGVQLVGGCCGIGPDHIRLIAKEFSGSFHSR